MSTLTPSVASKASLFAALQDATVQDALGGRLFGNIPQDTPRPVALIVVPDLSNESGFGLSRGPYKVEFRTYVFSDIGSESEAQTIAASIVALLSDATLTIDGFTQCGNVRWWETLEFPNSELYGVKVHEVASNFEMWVEQ